MRPSVTGRVIGSVTCDTCEDLGKTEAWVVFVGECADLAGVSEDASQTEIAHISAAKSHRFDLTVYNEVLC